MAAAHLCSGGRQMNPCHRGHRSLIACACPYMLPGQAPHLVNCLQVAEAPRQAASRGPRPPKVVSRPGDFNFEVLEKMRTSGETQQGTIVEANRGGFVVELAAGPKVHARPICTFFLTSLQPGRP